MVELDAHPLGQGLQSALAKSTGRRTVPNILVVGRSIGGGDDIEALDESGSLIEKVKDMAQKRIVEAKLSEEKIGLQACDFGVGEHGGLGILITALGKGKSLSR